mgnify:CR=1 FL=1
MSLSNITLAIGGGGEEADPELCPTTDLKGKQVRHQFADRCEVTDKSDADGQGYAEPDAVLGELAEEFVGAHRRLVEFHALVAITLGDLFRPHEDPGEDALRAGIAAPDTSCEYGDKEQAEGADDQQC